MIIIDGDLIELTNEKGITFDELEFLPYLNTPVKIKGELTLRKLKIILNDYAILKTIYSAFNIFIEQYNYDEMMKIKNEDSVYTKILLKNNFHFQKNNFMINEIIEEQELIEGLKNRFINIDYQKGDSIDFKMLTTVSLVDNKNKEHSISLVDLKDIVDIPIEISNGNLHFTEGEAVFNNNEQVISINKSNLVSELETELSFNELMVAISEIPDFNSIMNKRTRKELEKNKQILKKILKIDDIL